MKGVTMEGVTIGAFVMFILITIGFAVYDTAYKSGQADCLNWPDRCSEMVEEGRD